MAKHKKSQRNKYLMSSGVILALLAVGLMVIAFRGPTNMVQRISPLEYQSQFMASNIPYQLIDVRTGDEFAGGHIQGAMNISIDTLETRLNEISRNEPVVVYCRSGNRSAKAAQILANAGYTQIYDLGSINTWSEQGFPIE